MTAIVALWHWPPTKNKGKESSPKQTQIDNRQQIKAKAKAKRNENKTKQIHTHARQRSREFSQDTLERREGRMDRQTDVQTYSKSCPAYAGFQILIEKITEHFFFTTKLNRQLILHSSSIGGRYSSLPTPLPSKWATNSEMLPQIAIMA